MPFSKKEVRKCHLTLFSKFWRLNCITPLKSTLKVNEELEKEWQHLWHMHFKRKFMSRNAWSSSREISYQTADSVWLGLRLCSHSQYCLGRKTDQLYLCKVKMLVTQSCPTPCDLVDCSPPGSSVHGILQAGILEWVAIPFSRISSRPRDWTQSPELQADSLLSEPGLGLSWWSQSQYCLEKKNWSAVSVFLFITLSPYS